jgi:DNA-binding IscR family transcriptional regulator
MAIQPRGVAVLNRTIAEHIGVPPTYLAKVLQNLCRSNLLYSFRGKQGGFCLRERGKEINLMQIVHDKIPCLMHAEWLPIKQEIVKLLRDQTLGFLATTVLSGKYKLTDFPGAVLGGK